MEPGPKNAPESAPNMPQEAVRGVTKLKPRPDRPSPFGVQWFLGGKQKREFFPTEEARDDRYDSLVTKSKKGSLSLEMPRSQKRAMTAFLEAIGDTPWQDVVAGWRRDLESRGTLKCPKTVAVACKEYLEHAKSMLQQGDICLGTERHKRQKIGLFSDAFGANLLADITPEDVEAWIDDFGYESNGTFNSYRKQVSSVFWHHRRVVPKNPCEDIPQRSETTEHIEILTVEQTAQLFAYAQKHHRDALGRLALEAFAGLRFSSAFRLEKSDINFEDRGITLPAHKIKTGRRMYIDGLPDNVWTWLKATNDGCWAMESSEWMHLKSKLFTDAKVPHPRNCLRHGFCTYHVAAFKNPGLTATILCHRNQQKLWSNYNGIAKQSDGLAYFKIAPAA